jgi:hypothetical protein
MFTLLKSSFAAQSYVEIFMLLPQGACGSDARVQLTPTHIVVSMGEDIVLKGELFAAIKAEESVWLVCACPRPAHRLLLTV